MSAEDTKTDAAAAAPEVAVDAAQAEQAGDKRKAEDAAPEAEKK